MGNHHWPYMFVYLTPVIAMLDFGAVYIHKGLGWIFKLVWLVPLVGIGLVFAFPEVTLDPPSGPYQVGTLVMNLQDEGRMDIYSDKEGPREIRVQVFYPTETKSQSYVPWFLDGEGAAQSFAESYHLPGFFLSHLSDVKSHSILDAPIAKAGEFPVVIISHGWGSSRVLHQNLSEMLASNGYVVFAIDHTYAATMTRSSNGQLTLQKKDILPDEDYLDEAEEMIQVFSEDIGMVMDRLQFIQETHPTLKGTMNVFNVGLIGHSTGGGGVVHYAMNHEVTSVIGLDAWVEPMTHVERLDEASLYLRSMEWADVANNDKLKAMTYRIYSIEDSMHQDFSMAQELTPLSSWLKWSGQSSKAIQEEIILRFLNQSMKQVEDTLDFENIDRVQVNYP